MAVCKACEHYNVCLVYCSESVLRNRGICKHFKRGWTSVKDELPTHGFVYVWCAYTHSVEIAKYKGSLWRTQEKRYALNSDWVTHWMPMSEPPKED